MIKFFTYLNSRETRDNVFQKLRSKGMLFLLKENLRCSNKIVGR